ncbi:elongation factor 1-gamma-like [Microtus oregoni]|uniref:elongation factor 1-gamma-like n=1 Tax=Microtus oregoni TaxID=111838 RepID=UPI001BB155C4|nr:elongation factor 1-gamma-like [Microtus oregoni]
MEELSLPTTSCNTWESRPYNSPGQQNRARPRQKCGIPEFNQRILCDPKFATIHHSLVGLLAGAQLDITPFSSLELFVNTLLLPYFGEHFDKDGWSLWYAEYRFPEELTQTFMSCNLINGMFQRLDKLRKNAFASGILFGTNNSSSISGVWVFRGQELAFSLSPDWQVDYVSYTWQKLDPGSEETQTLVREYFSWEGAFQHVGKAVNQGKIFK